MLRRSLALLTLALTCVIWLSACTPGWMPTPTALPETRLVPRTLAAIPATRTPAPTSSPAATPSPRPTAKAETDAFAVAYFPWADSPAAFPMYVGEGQARIVNSIFFEDPPFFGFDIHPPEGWYHVVGVDEWAATDAGLISPTINRNWQPRDGDRVLIHGHIDGEFVTASYVGLADGTFYYYRSLLHADELRREVLPSVYDGLEVWVRGVLDSSEGQGQFYVLPEGVSFDPSYLGQEALVAGRLSVGDRIAVEITNGIYAKHGTRYTNILEGKPFSAAGDVYESGIIRALDPSARWLLIESADGRSVEVEVSEATAIGFADGSQAELPELSRGRRIEVTGRASAKDKMSAIRLTIVGTAPEGSMYAAYMTGANVDLWSVRLDGLERRRVTSLSEPAPGIGDAEFSPDGSRYAFARKNGGQSTLVTADLQSGELREWLTNEEWQEADPAWSPDGSRIAFCRWRVNGEQRIDGALWVLTLRDGTIKRLTDPATEGWRTVQPRWSPDGRQIAFGQVSDDASQPSRLYVLSFPSQSQLILEWGFDWRWSPDSTHLVCTRQTTNESRPRIWVVQRDGTSATWLSTTGVHDHNGRLSPDGTAIAFLSRPWGSGGPDHLWIMQADGMRRFQPEGQPLAGGVAWSADSQAIVFVRVTSSGENAGLWLVGRDGSGLRQLAADATALVGTYRAP
jgi:Tol biopolymer transport system component